MTKKSNLYVGRSGQLAVLSEFLMRGYNVAIPEVDVGDDVFVVKDDGGEYWRIQVKAARGKTRKYGYSTQFTLRRSQLVLPVRPALHYVLVGRHLERWQDFMVISRAQLLNEHLVEGVGTLSDTTDKKTGEKPSVTFTLRFHDKKVLCSDRDWQAYRNDWSRWPLIKH